jgi:very-short-patch-repair endonuclease
MACSRESKLFMLGPSRSLIQRRLTSGRWERLYADVFRVAGAPSSWRQSLFAACLAKGSEAIVSHRAAAALWVLPGFRPGPIEIIVPRSRRRASMPGVVVRRLAPIPPADRTVLDAIPVTTPPRTLIDIAAEVPPDIVEEALDDAIRRGLVSLARLRWRLSELARSGRPGISTIRALAAERDPGACVPQSVFETRLLRILNKSSLPTPIIQHRVADRGRLVAVVDFAFPSFRVAVEADGYRWHSGRMRWQHDLTRRNALTALGWRVVHVTWIELASEPDRVVDAIRRVLTETAGPDPR